MKKVLFATTVLVAAASAASAEVKLSGYGRFGLDYNDMNSIALNGTPSTSITSRLRLQIDMSTETDGGVAFGARFRIQDSDANNNATAGTTNSARFYASANGFTLGVGNIWGALDSMPGMYLPTQSGDTGVDGMSYYAYPVLAAHDGYSSGGVGAHGAEALWSSGSFALHVSYSADSSFIAGTPQTSKRFAGNASYTFGDWTAAVGFQSSDVLGEDVFALSVEGNVGNIGLGVAYAKNQDFAGAGNDVNVIRIYGSMDIGASSKAILWATNRDYGSVVNAMDGTSFGLHFQSDLGGGVSIQAGIVEAANNNTQAQAGVKFNF